jgi:NADPH-dependent 7-cyano-7-deazaguanine reductase QueF-like protein
MLIRKEEGTIRAQSRVKYFWCLHCERAWSRDQFGLYDDNCPDPECDGWGYGKDIWTWYNIRRCNPEFPKVPVIGKYYSS